MSQIAKETALVSTVDELITSSSYHSLSTNAFNGERLPTFSALPSAAPACSTKDTTEAETDPELLKQQLQLIQLCFAEHEFGIVVDENDGGDDSFSSSSDDDGSRSSSESPQHDPGNGVVAQRSSHHHHYSPYDPLTFINEKVQHGVPLAVLSHDLHSYAQYLEDKIAECVNTDVHTAFVNVSGHLVGMRDELSYMERPLVVAMEKLSGSASQLSAMSLGVKNKVEAVCAAEMERNFDAVYLKGIVVYETLAYQLEDLAQLLQITVDATPSRSSAVAVATTTRGSGSSPRESSSPHASPASQDAATKGSHLKKEVYVIAPDARLSDAALDILEDIVLLFQELKGAQQRLVSLPSHEQEKADMAVYVAAAEQSVMGVLEVVLVHVSRMTVGLTATTDLLTGVTPTKSTEASVAAPSPATRHLLGRVVELYGQAGEREQFCAVFRNAVLRPPLEAVVSWKAATLARQNVEGTVALLEQMKNVLQTKYLPLLPLLRENYGTPLHPVATIVWPILSETLVKKLPSLYEVGIPNHFQIKYKAAYSVLAMVEAACADLDELAALRQSPDVVLWNHKWNLDVYAALRVSEVDKALQSVSPLDRLAPSTEHPYHLRLIYIVHQQLLHLFSSSVYLYLCTPRFLRQTVACCYRVLQRVQEAVARSPAVASALGPATESGSSTGDSGGAARATDAAADSAANYTLLFAISDGHALRSFLTSKLLQLILECLKGEEAVPTTVVTTMQNMAKTHDSSAVPPSERSTAALVTEVIEFAGNTVCGQFVRQARATLVHQVTDAALGPLQNVKSVRSAYSHTRKTIPSAASWYVAPVLQPLQRFAEAAQQCGFAGAEREESVVEMLRVIVKQFVLLAKDTLITAKKTEESWEKLRRRKEGGAASPLTMTEGGAAEAAALITGAGEGSATAACGQRVTMETATDRDKMTIQLWMDARELWQAVQQPPLSVLEEVATTAFTPAFELLRRAEWIQGANIPEPPDVDA